MSTDVITATDEHGNTASVTIVKGAAPVPIPPVPVVTVASSARKLG